MLNRLSRVVTKWTAPSFQVTAGQPNGWRYQPSVPWSKSQRCTGEKNIGGYSFSGRPRSFGVRFGGQPSAGFVQKTSRIVSYIAKPNSSFGSA